MIGDIAMGPIGFSVAGVAGHGLILFTGMLTTQRRRNHAQKNLPRLLRKRAATEVFVSFTHPDIA